MLKQSPIRNQRSKGFKVKHVLQICLLVAICIWLLYQVKHSHDKKKAYEDSSLKISAKMQSGYEIIKLGRRDLHHPRVKDVSLKIEKQEGKEEYPKGEVEESKPEESDQEEGKGGGDDDIDAPDQERAEDEESEEGEDLIDEEDREREEGSEEQETEDEEIDFGDMKLSKGQTKREDKSISQEAREEHYKDDDASSAVRQRIQTVSGSLRKFMEEDVESLYMFEGEREIERYNTKDFSVGMGDSDTKLHRSLTAKSFAAESAGRVKEMGNEYASFHSNDAMNHSTSLIKAKPNEQSVKNDLTLLLVKEPTSLNGTNILPEGVSDLSLDSNEGYSYLGTIWEKLNQNPEATSVQKHSNSTLSAIENSDAIKVRMTLNGSESSVTKEVLQFQAIAGTEKSSDNVISNANAAGSGESKMNGEMRNGEESLMTLAENNNLDAVQKESIDSSDFSSYQEDKEADSVMSSE